MFTVLPAIDVAAGRLATWTPDGSRALDVFDGDPLRAARELAAAGARWLHVVDLDLAFREEMSAVRLVTELASAHPGIALQLSGGIRSLQAAETYLEAGASRVVLASAALHDPDDAVRTIGRLDDRVVVGIEVAGGAIVPRGLQGVEMDLMATLGWLVAVGARSFLVTAVARVGTSGGPDREVIRRVTRAGRPTLAAGGIGSLRDLRAVRDAGATGAVVGSAALRGTLDVREALAWASA